MKQTVAAILARKIEAYHNCNENNNPEWKKRHSDVIARIQDDHLPRGSGIDMGTGVYVGGSMVNGERLVFDVPYHHMNEWGGYVGWVDYDVIATPSFIGHFDLHVQPSEDQDFPNGVDEFQVEQTCEYLADLFYDALTAEIDPATLVEEWENEQMG